ncbi:unnamed protein product [Dicrocoelium dendriticum]|nr:unnamed protein product [Dicrocoelium dendriticum]
MPLRPVTGFLGNTTHTILVLLLSMRSPMQHNSTPRRRSSSSNIGVGVTSSRTHCRLSKRHLTSIDHLLVPRFHNTPRSSVQIPFSTEPIFSSQTPNEANPTISPPSRSRATRGRRPARQTLKVGCWNVRTLHDRDTNHRPMRRTALVAMELARYDIDIAALSETRLADQGKLREDGAGYTFYWIGNPEAAPREQGVGFAITDRLNGRLTGEPIGISPRLMSLRICLRRGKFATFISTYSPTMSYTEDRKDQYYSQLATVIKSVPMNDRLFLLGDFNARVGCDATVWAEVIGPHGIGIVNGNGERLLSLCATHGLTITNTQFALCARDIATWTHPRSGHAHLLDYVIVRQRDMREVRITRVMRGAECGTDHKLVRTKFYINVYKSSYFPANSNRRKYNVRALMSAEKRQALEDAIRTRLGEDDSSASVSVLWDHLKKQVTIATEETIGCTNCKRPDWFDENSLTIGPLVRAKNAAFIASEVDPNNTMKSNAFRHIRRQLAGELRQVQNTWWTMQAAQMESYAEHRQQKEFYDSLKAVYGPTVQ